MRGTTVRDLLALCSFPPVGTRVRCALSGGADSTALTALAVAAGCEVSAIHANHGLRPDSDMDEAAARHTADVLGIPFESVSLGLVDGPNLESRARDSRRDAFGTDVLTGHTADDAAETVLLALLRGAGARGLSGIPAGPTHPIIALRRHETRTLCAHLDLTFVDDPTNTDARFRRNRVRHELLPLMDEIADKDVIPNLVRTAGLLHDDDALLDELAGALDPTDARAITRASRPLARRAIRRWIAGDGLPPDAATVSRVLDVAAGRAGACEVGRGQRVDRTQQRLRLSPQRPNGR